VRGVVGEGRGGEVAFNNFIVDSSHPNWASHKKHIFVVSNSGRPIYTR
jgi:hypothetical protein